MVTDPFLSVFKMIYANIEKGVSFDMKCSHLEESEKLARIIQENAPAFMDGSSRSDSVLKAVASIDRTPFLPLGCEHLADRDDSIAVGSNQTTSQPSLLAFMFDKLKIEPGDRVLEIGTGVGYAAALASRLCGDSGRIITVEIIPSLVEKARENLKKFSNIEVMEGDGSIGWDKGAPYDAIFLSAGTGPDFDNKPLLKQLAPKGRLMVPRKFGELFLYSKEEEHLPRETFFSVNFVPLRGQNSG